MQFSRAFLFTAHDAESRCNSGETLKRFRLLPLSLAQEYRGYGRYGRWTRAIAVGAPIYNTSRGNPRREGIMPELLPVHVFEDPLTTLCEQLVTRTTSARRRAGHALHMQTSTIYKHSKAKRAIGLDLRRSAKACKRAVLVFMRYFSPTNKFFGNTGASWRSEIVVAGPAYSFHSSEVCRVVFRSQYNAYRGFYVTLNGQFPRHCCDSKIYRTHVSAFVSQDRNRCVSQDRDEIVFQRCGPEFVDLENRDTSNNSKNTLNEQRDKLLNGLAERKGILRLYGAQGI